MIKSAATPGEVQDTTGNKPSQLAFPCVTILKLWRFKQIFRTLAIAYVLLRPQVPAVPAKTLHRPNGKNVLN